MHASVDRSDPDRPAIHVTGGGYAGEHMTPYEAEKLIKDIRKAIDEVRAASSKPRKFGEH